MNTATSQPGPEGPIAAQVAQSDSHSEIDSATNQATGTAQTPPAPSTTPANTYPPWQAPPFAVAFGQSHHVPHTPWQGPPLAVAFGQSHHVPHTPWTGQRPTYNTQSPLALTDPGLPAAQPGRKRTFGMLDSEPEATQPTARRVRMVANEVPSPTPQASHVPPEPRAGMNASQPRFRVLLPKPPPFHPRPTNPPTWNHTNPPTGQHPTALSTQTTAEASAANQATELATNFPQTPPRTTRVRRE
ncbi:hypothetical protein B0T19DRAFT_445501 [Cercophora scortea]|uniref:Uncharacterized protein n=1 Tax=Cercophora scortea TaxID=314031 RepID=A0AAE0M5V3_9PEZI|nr:hypothetical protein B0T19DRAFT_445501 [Cercophora scortea]